MQTSGGNGQAYELTDPGLALMQVFQLGVSSGRDFGIAWHGGELFVGGLFGGMELYDATSGADLGAVVHGDGTPFAFDEVGPSVFVGGDLVILSDLGVTYYTPTIIPGG